VAREANFSGSVELVEIKRLTAGPQGIDWLLAPQARNALGMIVADLLDALWLRQLDQ
jgi:hypothetical protein